MRGHGGTPRRVTIERVGRHLWRFEVLNDRGECIDYSLASRMGLAWRMARRSWRHAERKARP